MQKQTLRHRHFLAAPICVVLFGISGLPALHAELLTSPDVPVDGIEVLLHDGQFSKTEEGIELDKGSFLIKANDLATVRIDNTKLLSALGGFHVSNTNTLTVAAITAPVLIDSAQGKVLVPVGFQWKHTDALVRLEAGEDLWAQGREMQPIPPRFLQDMQQQIPVAHGIASDLPPARSVQPVRPEQTLLFEGAKQRENKEYEHSVLSYVRWLVEWDDTNTAQALLADEEVFASAYAQRLLVALLPVAQTQNMRTVLLQHIVASQDSAVLLAFHPLLADLAVVLGDSFEAQEDEWMFILGYPRADWNDESLSDIAIRKWQERAVQYLANSTDPVPSLDVLIQRLSVTVQKFEAKGYPQRARRLAAALDEISLPYRPILSDRIVSDIDAMLRSLDRVNVESAQETEEVVQEEPQELLPSPADIPEIPAEVLQAQTSEILQNAGALFRVDTRITVAGPTQAQIHGIVFAGVQGDSIVSFILDLHTKTVQSVVKDGKQYPYALPLEDFLVWIKG